MFFAACEINGKGLPKIVEAIESQRAGSGDASASYDSVVWRDRFCYMRQSGCLPNIPKGAVSQRFSPSSVSLPVVLWGRIDNREELSSKLDLGSHAWREIADQELIARAYSKWGKLFAKHVVGEYSLVIHDPVKRLTLAVRDSQGCKPLYYWNHQKFIALSPSAADFLNYKEELPAPEDDWIIRYLLSTSADRSATPWSSINKLPPSSILSIVDGKLRVESYYSFNDSTNELNDAHDWVDAYRSAFQEAVRCRTMNKGPIGCESSGGLDSSSILGMTARLRSAHRSDIHTLGICLFDYEFENILASSKYCDIQFNHITTSMFNDHDRESIERSLTAIGYPIEHNYPLYAQPLYSTCQRQGITELLSGLGGDEAVSANGSELFFELLDQRNWGELFSKMREHPRWSSRLLFRDQSKRFPAVSKPEAYRQERESAWGRTVVSIASEAVESHHERFINFPNDIWPNLRTVNGRAIALLNSNYLPTRLETSSLLAQSYGIDYRWPLLDRRLIEVYLAAPSIEKWGNGMGRYLHRRACEGLIPPEIQWCPSKNVGKPYKYNRRVRQEAKLKLLLPIAEALITDPHPRVEKLVNWNKYREQVEQVKVNPFNKGAWFDFRTNTRLLSTVDIWLKKYYS